MVEHGRTISILVPMKYGWILLGLLSAAPAAGAQQWFAVNAPAPTRADTIVEIDLETLRIHASGGAGVIRVTFGVLQPHEAGFGYRSFVATAQFDCQRREMALTSSAYFALPSGQGLRLGADSSGRDSGMPPALIERIPAPARQALVKAACAPSQN